MHLALAHLRQLRLRGGRYLRDGKIHDFDAVSGQLREGSNLRCGFVAQQELAGRAVTFFNSQSRE
eukprot:142143-Prorocentrum_minimum.AAC.1